MNQLFIRKDDRILIIAPHPDDESIGCGGLISMYPAQCEILVMTDGAQSDKKILPEAMREIRKNEFISAMKISGINDYRMLDYPDGELIFHPECLHDVEWNKYTKIMIPYHQEAHSDHRAVYQFLIDILKDIRFQNMEVLQYETRQAVNTDQVYYIDVSEAINKKKLLISQYKSQIKAYDYVGFSESLMRYRACIEGAFGRCLEAYIPIDRKENESEQIPELLAGYRKKNDILDLWLRLKINGKEIGKYLSAKYKRVAIYGFGYFGKLIYKDLNQYVTVSCIIDREAERLHEENIKFVLPEQRVDADILIISNMFGWEGIKKEMQMLGYHEVVALWDILIKVQNEEQLHGTSSREKI